jgi:hypothetical protein
MGIDLEQARHQARSDEVSTLVEVPIVEPAERWPRSEPWDNWDVSMCPVKVLEDGYLIVFGKSKKRLISEKKIQLILGLVERYPNGGFDKPGLIKRFGKGARQAFYWLKRIDADCEAAFQPAGVKARSLYRIGRLDL